MRHKTNKSLASTVARRQTSGQLAVANFTSTTSTASTIPVESTTQNPTKVHLSRKSTSGPPPPPAQSSEISPRYFMCPACGERFGSLIKRDFHFRLMHPGLKVFGCQICGMSYDTYTNFRQHCTTRHTENLSEALFGGSGPADKLNGSKVIKSENNENNDSEMPLNSDDNPENVCRVCSLAFFKQSVLTLHILCEHGGAGGRKRRREILESQRQDDDNVDSLNGDEQSVDSEANFGESNEYESPLTKDFCLLKRKRLGSVQEARPNILYNGVVINLSRWEKLWLSYMGLSYEKDFLPYDKLPAESATDLLPVTTPSLPSMNSTPLSCIICQESLDNSLELAVHRRREHSHELDIALKALGETLTLDEEEIQDEQIMGCHICYRIFMGPSSIADIKMHRKTFHCQLPCPSYECEKCKMSFSRLRQLEWHSDNNEGGPCQMRLPLPMGEQLLQTDIFACPECSKIFTGSSAESRLKEHLEICSKE